MEDKKHQSDCKTATGKCIKGIVCDVKNCAYHAGESDCHAGTICVGPCDAKCSANTVCATFKPREC